MRLNGKLGGGYEEVEDSYEPERRGDRKGKYYFLITGSKVYPEPIEQWVLRNCPLVKDYAIASRQQKIRKDARADRYIVAFCVPAEGVGEREAETALLEVIQRLKPRHRPKRLVWLNVVPKLHPDMGGGYDRYRLRRCTIGKPRFDKERLARGKGSRLEIPAIRGASNQWQMEGFLRYHPVVGREEENKDVISIVIAHVDALTREERIAPALVSNQRLVRMVRKYRRGYRVSVAGHFGKHGRLVCDQIVHIKENVKRVALGNIDMLAEALVQ